MVGDTLLLCSNRLSESIHPTSFISCSNPFQHEAFENFSVVPSFKINLLIQFSSFKPRGLLVLSHLPLVPIISADRRIKINNQTLHALFAPLHIALLHLHTHPQLLLLV
jgi:hypothetical protein